MSDPDWPEVPQPTEGHPIVWLDETPLATWLLQTPFKDLLKVPHVALVLCGYEWTEKFKRKRTRTLTVPEGKQSSVDTHAFDEETSRWVREDLDKAIDIDQLKAIYTCTPPAPQSFPPPPAPDCELVITGMSITTVDRSDGTWTTVVPGLGDVRETYTVTYEASVKLDLTCREVPNPK